MWRELWPDRAVDDVPIGHVTNGVHVPTWLGGPMRDAARPPPRRRLARSRGRPGDVGAASTRSPTRSCGPCAAEQRAALVDYVRGKSVTDRLGRDEPRGYVEAAAGAFDPDALTIGFARRLATYKRLHLLVQDADARARAARQRAARPARASPARRIRATTTASAWSSTCSRFKWAPEIGGRVVYLDDYDLSSAARHGARLRRLAQPAAAAAGGERHERHEVGGQRRAAAQRARRLVGRGLRRRQRLGAAGRGGRRPRRAGPARRRRAAPAARARRSRASSTTATTTGIPRAWLARVRASLQDERARRSPRRGWCATTSSSSTARADALRLRPRGAGRRSSPPGARWLPRLVERSAAERAACPVCDALGKPEAQAAQATDPRHADLLSPERAAWRRRGDPVLRCMHSLVGSGTDV